MSLQPRVVEPAVQLYVGAQANTVQGERVDLTGTLCFSAAVKVHKHGADPRLMRYLLDSGAFSDPPERRLTPETALARQLDWEQRAAAKWGHFQRAEAFVSYDLLIDEVWVNGERHKRRWTIQQAERAVQVTVDAARYLVSQRDDLAPRRLVLSCQGVNASQYLDCAREVLAFAQPDDWLGMGGWCIVGRWRSWLPELQHTAAGLMPLVAAAGLSRVHVFGVLWEPALASILWYADQHGIALSTDSTGPILASTYGNQKRAGARHPHWRGNLDWWKAHLSGLRSSRYYREPYLTRQLQLLEVA